jgi:hypothetical protein
VYAGFFKWLVSANVTGSPKFQRQLSTTPKAVVVASVNCTGTLVHRVDGIIKLGKKPGKTLMGLTTESIHSPDKDTTNLILKTPAAVKVWVGI